MINILFCLSKKYDILSVTYDINSVNGICMRNYEKYFFKILNQQNANDEILGYELAQSFVPCTLLCETIRYDEQYVVFIYSYEENIRYNYGLLYDYLCDDHIEYNQFVDTFRQILQFYAGTFEHTSKKAKSKALNKFVYDRIEPRLKAWYWDLDLAIEYQGVYSSIANISQEIYVYMKDYKPSEYHLTHGDPSDMNVTVTPKFLDYTTFGYNPILLEFASFYWNLTFGGLYFFPKYHKQKYELHQYSLPEIDVNWDECEDGYHNVSYNYDISEKRVAAVELLIAAFQPYLHFTAQEIVYFIVFRMITILNIHELEKKDQVLMLAMVQRLMGYAVCDDKIFEKLSEFVKSDRRI